MSVSYSGPVTVNAVAFTGDPSHSWGFESQSLLISSPGPSAVLISFDGTSVDGRVEPGVPKEWKQSARKIWLRLEVAGAQLAYVEVEDTK